MAGTPSNDLNISQPGYVVFDGIATFTGRTFQAGTGITISNTDGISGNTTISLSGGGAATEHLTGNTGGTLNPDGSNNFNTLGTGSITIAGSGSTLTTQLTGLTNHAVLVGAGTATITKVGPTATAGQVLQSGGSSADPVFSTATYPATTTINQILYSSAANTVSELTTANRGVLTTGATGIPIITALGTDGQLIIGSTAGAPAAATLTQGTGITITNGSNSISIAVSGSVVGQTITGNSGGALSPTAGNWNLLGSGSITTSGSGSTLTTQLTGLTNHAVLVGAGTATVTKVGPTATAGQILQSGGSSADPVFSTATYPATATATGTILRADGTNWVASTPTYPNAASTAGKVVISDGTNLIMSTPTFPNASATTGKIIISDGTNWIASTPTYPAAAGTSGNVLTSDGTNWTSAAAPGGGLLSVSGTLTNTQVKNLHGTPVQIIAAPGSGKMINLIYGVFTMNYGGTNAFTAAASQTINAYWGTTVNSGINMTNGGITATSSQASLFAVTGLAGQAYTNFANVAVNIYNSTATEISGNAANDNTVSYNIIYRIITIP